MHDIAQLLITFVNPIIMIMAIVLTMSMMQRSGPKKLNLELVMAGTFSLALGYSMADPITLSTGGIFDMRGLLIGTAMAIFGLRVGILTLCAGLIFRWSIGNPGMLAGFTGMIIAFFAGMVWRYAVRPRLNRFWARALSLGLMISLQNLAIFVADPQFWGQLFVSLGIYTVVCNLIGTFLIKYLFHSEMKFLTAAKGMEKAASTDHLTGWLNRRSLEQSFDALSKRPTGKAGLTAMYFDIDNFKTVNDTFGHAAGDSVLQGITRRLSTALRAQDIVSRLGGDEFVVIMPNLTPAEAKTVAERCRKLVADSPIIHEDIPIPVSVSIGAVWAKRWGKLDQFLHFADQELYKAKNMGRNVTSFAARPIIEPRQPSHDTQAA